jgi:hypothetical protein
MSLKFQINSEEETDKVAGDFTVGNCEVIPQALWPIAKSLMKGDGLKAPTAIHGPLEITYQPDEKADVTADFC